MCVIADFLPLISATTSKTSTNTYLQYVFDAAKMPILPQKTHVNHSLNVTEYIYEMTHRAPLLSITTSLSCMQQDPYTRRTTHAVLDDATIRHA